MKVGSAFLAWVTQPLLTTIVLAGPGNATAPTAADNPGALTSSADNQSAAKMAELPNLDREPSGYPDTRTGDVHKATETPEQSGARKLRNLSGNLVDTNCVASFFRRLPSLDQLTDPDPLARFSQVVENSRRADQTRDSIRGSPPKGVLLPLPQPAGPINSAGELKSSEHDIAPQAAELRRADIYKRVSKACTPDGPTTQRFGLVISDRQLVKFDKAGNLKAKEAVVVGAIEPGRAVKARVKGVIEGAGSTATMLVNSIQIKSRNATNRALPELGSR